MKKTSKYIIFYISTGRFIGGVKYQVHDETATDYIIGTDKISKEDEYKTYEIGDVVN
jgi:hypothetical protein